MRITGWRAAVYRTDGTLDLGVHLNSWEDADKISILKVFHNKYMTWHDVIFSAEYHLAISPSICWGLRGRNQLLEIHYLLQRMNYDLDCSM